MGNEKAEAQSYLDAAQNAGLSAKDQMARIQAANQQANGAGASGSSAAGAGCVRDFATGRCVSFLSKQRVSAPPSVAAVIRPFMQSVLDMRDSDSRVTQAPLVWLKLHPQ